MARFGPVWEDHRARLISNWKKLITYDDLVLVPGDFTFAKDETLFTDLADFNDLPGHKVFVPGNHDKWFMRRKSRELEELFQNFPTITYLHDKSPAYMTGDYVIIGYRGSDPPDFPAFVENRWKHTVSLSKAISKQLTGVVDTSSTVIVITHYVPSTDERKIMQQFNPKLWLHGHAHLNGNDEHLVRDLMKTRKQPSQYCISSDYLDMVPVEVTGGVVRHVSLPS